MSQGLDISQYQGEANFDLIQDNAEFVIIRASFGAPDPGQLASHYVDPQFRRNQSEARRTGIRRGYYHYCYPQYNSPAAEVDQFLGTIGPLEPGEFVALDFEERFADPVPWVKAWLDSVAIRTGILPLVYMNLNTARGHDWTSVSSTYPLWVAFWDNNPAAAVPDLYWPAGIIIHQYGLVSFMHADGDSAWRDLVPFGVPPKVDVPISPAVPATPAVAPFKHFLTHITVKLNVRKEPTTGSAKVLQPTRSGCIEPPFTLEVFGLARGEKVKGNDVWFKTWKGNWIWSGGCDTNVTNLSIS